eukprot:CAMPEP_0175221128 /NCGR_PEP_ID=MMETSP0093-20121207/20147_1 /TAXON_ID=311494 /ORGANISM="Alexandrium monilatum, Strain CCMP3105" /LENGTH=108 /DNA_ID=CAMNT_0016514671 /DNA_START=103 /DNA_END=425 /DNA_ORIENTATION=-
MAHLSWWACQGAPLPLERAPQQGGQQAARSWHGTLGTLDVQPPGAATAPLRHGTDRTDSRRCTPAPASSQSNIWAWAKALGTEYSHKRTAVNNQARPMPLQDFAGGAE